MESHFLILDYIKNLENTENFRNTLYKKGIMSKYYETEGHYEKSATQREQKCTK